MRNEQPLITPDGSRAPEPARTDSAAPGPPALGREEVQAIVSAAPTVTVIGDIMLDCWLHGRSSRLAREAPVAVVEQGSEVLSPGGAANTAMNLAALGARVRMVGVIGDDESGRTVKDLLVDADVDVSGVLTSEQVATTKKTRIVVDDHILLRLDCLDDKDSAEGVSEPWLEELCSRARHALDGSAALVIADYGGAIHSAQLPERLAREARPALTVVDAHEPEQWKLLRPDVVTPNADEAERLVDASFRDDPRRVELAQRFAPAVREATNAEAAVITLDRDGSVSVDGTDDAHLTTAHPVPERQASGAGDTFVAGLTMALVAGLRLALAAEFAQMAADVAIRGEGTSLCTGDDLLQLVGGPRRTVLALGHFDPLSSEDRTFLTSARRLGDYLVVAVDRDAGEDGAALRSRMQLLNAHPSVDLVAEYAFSASEVIESLRPDVIAFDSSGTGPQIALPQTGGIPLVDVSSTRGPDPLRTGEPS
ncbi:PfkB family carbohydrate kinase [Brevibacterium renqingii]|uniref:PfkB family carbohydrate kinase n=1 Tax=Brevibacterium renqingii TaxID=2776916 RepID=UPI001ADF2A4C|nr:PfkB family carbohydrate kinase [Brevibacterium renqingii]